MPPPASHQFFSPTEEAERRCSKVLGWVIDGGRTGLHIYGVVPSGRHPARWRDRLRDEVQRAIHEGRPGDLTLPPRFFGKEYDSARKVIDQFVAEMHGGFPLLEYQSDYGERR